MESGEGKKKSYVDVSGLNPVGHCLLLTDHTAVLLGFLTPWFLSCKKLAKNRCPHVEHVFYCAPC